MESRSAYRLQLMEKLGAPFLAALPDNVQGEKAAEAVAALTAKAVQAGLRLSQSMKLSDQDGDIDSVRLSLAALAAPLLADSYKDAGKLPDDAAVEKIAKGLEAVLVFAENFTPAMEHSARLQTLHTPLPVIDETQVTILTLNALVPAVRAVQKFSFGQSAPALMKDIAKRLDDTAAKISEAAVTGGESDRVFGKLMVLRALAELYAAAQESAVRAHQGDSAPDIARVWQIFDEQTAMMLALAGAAVPAEGIHIATGGDNGSSAPPPQEAPQAAPSQPAAGGSPMGFFKKPEEGQTAPAAAAQSQAAPPPQSPAPEQSPPPASSGGNPMAFFKPGAKKADGEE